MALALALGCAALTGAAFAGPPDDPGKSENAPGQEKKAEAPAPAPAATPPASPGKSASAPGKTKTGKAATPSKGKSQEAKVQVQGNQGGRSAEAHQHVIICHRTGSDSNPYVVINIPLTAWNEAHSDTTGKHPAKNDRKDFILEGPAGVTPGDKKGHTKAECRQIAGLAAPTVPQAPAQVTQQVLAQVTQQAPAQAQVTQQPVGEVAGVQGRIAKPKAKPRGGVLGRLGAVAGQELPFTGLPLWIAALIGLGLLGAGFGARKTMR